MNVKKRCFVYCNDCHGKNPWRIVDADSTEAVNYRLGRHANCHDFQKKHCYKKCDNGAQKNKCRAYNGNFGSDNNHEEIANGHKSNDHKSNGLYEININDYDLDHDHEKEKKYKKWVK